LLDEQQSNIQAVMVCLVNPLTGSATYSVRYYSTKINKKLLLESMSILTEIIYLFKILSKQQSDG